MTNVSAEIWSRSTEDRRNGQDRRIVERRRVNLIVSLDRRRGEARRADRRQGASVLALRKPWAAGALQTILRQGVARVRATWSTRIGDAVPAEEVDSLLGAIERTLLLREHADERLRSTLGRCLLGLVRTEVVRGAAAADDLVRAGGLWSLMEAIEHLQETLEPEWHEHFASRLAGPDGLEMVVEVAHDLRSPLTSVLFLAEVLAQGQSGSVNPLQHRQLGLIYSAALGLTELTGNVIELARGGNRLTDGEPSPFSVAELMGAVADIVRPIAEEKDIEIRIVPPVSDQRLGHSVALSRVLLNLTTNALKFKHEGFVEIGARETLGSRVEFSVRDTGPGINQQAEESLFAAFRRAPTGQGFMLSGTGLGLSLCRKLVSVMGGELQVETRGDWGTRFSFDLVLPPVDLR